jgi:hypothetical protein
MEGWGNLPSAVAEARSMVGLAQLVGVDSVRNLILITDKQKAELHAWAREEPLVADRIGAVIQFREKVLVLFDKLLDRQAEKKRAA